MTIIQQMIQLKVRAMSARCRIKAWRMTKEEVQRLEKETGRNMPWLSTECFMLVEWGHEFRLLGAPVTLR
jgi:hypothetical protein